MSIFAAALTLLLYWGALAIGGWPSWAAAPVLVFGITTGILGFLESRHHQKAAQESGSTHIAIAVALGFLVAAIGTQLIPLSEQLVTRLSPARNEMNYERMLAMVDRRDPELVPEVPAGAPRPLSIAPSRTRLGFAAVAGFAIFLMGAARGLSATGVRRITGAVIILGVLVSFIGIYRFANGTVTVYGLYVHLSQARESAPFHNRNHQAGWLAMVLALGLGTLAGEVARGMRGVAPRWRDRIVWFSSKQANVAALILFASVVISIGILTTQSRSGAMALTATFLIFIVWALRKQPTRMRRAALAFGLFVVLLGVVAYSGEGVAQRFAYLPGSYQSRVAIWQDTLTIAKRFWLTGTGFNTFGVAMLRYQTVMVNGRLTERYIEAHNDYLQLAAEGGLLVVVPALILAVTVIATVYRRFREGADDTRTYWIRVGAVAGLCAIAIQSVSDFTLQIPGAFAMFATLVAIAIHRPQPRAVSRDIR